MPGREECERVVRQLWPYLDDALAPEWREQIVAHLERCTDCTSHFEFERAFLDAVQTAGMIAADAVEPLRARVVSALARDGFDDAVLVEEGGR